jgi:membrane protein
VRAEPEEAPAAPKGALRRWWGIFVHAAGLWLERNAFVHAGSLAFYTLFSMAPVVIIAVTVAGLLFGEEAARGEIVAQIEEVAGREGAEAIEEAVARSRIDEAGLLPTLLGLAALIVGATTVFAQLQLSLNDIWGVVAKPRRSGALIFLKNRVLSLAMVIAIGFLLLVSLLASVVVRALLRYGEEWIPFQGRALATTAFLLSFLVFTLLFAAIFKILPDVYLAWRDVWIGAGITALLFMLGRYLIALYLTYTAPWSTYGAAGSLVLVLLWVYYTSLILLFGAALTKALTLASGREVIPRALAVRVHHEIVEEEL